MIPQYGFGVLPKEKEIVLSSEHVDHKWRARSQIKKFLTITETTAKEEAERLDSLKSAVSQLQEQLTEQRLVTQVVSEENLSLKERIDKTERKLAEIEKAIHEYSASDEGAE